MELVPRFLQIPEQSCFLFGPRGTGKSTWLHHQFPEALYLDLLEPELYRSLAARPERLRELMAGSPHTKVVVIDEIQRVPELLTVVHALLEASSAPRFVLIGSSARKLRRGGVDLLAGRAVPRTLHPFMAAELPDFDLDQALRVGLLPLVVSAPDATDVLKAYANLYLDEEVRAEGLTRNSHDKLYLFDAGVFRSLRPKGPLDRPEEIDGPALEGLVAQHLRAWIAYSNSDLGLYFWRTRAGSEVDFIVYGESIFQAIEVKNASRIHTKDLRALKTFRQDYPEAQGMMLYRGRERLLMDDILCLPVEEFLRDLIPGGSDVQERPL